MPIFGSYQKLDHLMYMDLNQRYISPSSNSKNYLYLFLIWPFLAFLLALKNYSQKEAKTVVYIFFIYYGLTFVISNQFADAARYASTLKLNSNLPFSDFFKIVGGIYATDTSVDIAEPFISFVVSRFSSNPNVLFAVYAAIFGFFYLNSVNLMHNRYQKNPNLNGLIYLIFFSLILPITAINGFRMWTAAWIFFYGAYHVILRQNSKFILLALSSSLVHWSFLSANVILIIYYFVGNRNFIYLPLTLLSFIVPNLIAPLIQMISLQFGGAIQNRYEGYSSTGYILSQQESLAQASWFIKIGTDLVLYFFIVAIILIQFKSRYIKEKEEKNLFSFLLLFLSFVNFGKSIPSFGERFLILFFLFASLYLFLYFIKFSSNRISLLTWLGLFPMILNVAITFRISSDSISAWILTPGFGLPLFSPIFSIADILFV
jgi:hypothetical protein